MKKSAKFSRVEIASVITDISFREINFISNYDRLAMALSKVEKYQDRTPEAALRILGASYPNLQTACNEFKNLIHSWIDRGDGLTFVNLSMNINFIFQKYGLPENFEICWEEEDEEEAQAMKPEATQAPVIMEEKKNAEPKKDPSICPKCGMQMGFRKAVGRDKDFGGGRWVCQRCED